MSKLSLYKWVYELGIKHTEHKYYNALKSHADKLSEVVFINQLTDEPSMEQRRRYEFEKAVSVRLVEIINDVFRPIEPVEKEIVETELKNRFEL